MIVVFVLLVARWTFMWLVMIIAVSDVSSWTNCMEVLYRGDPALLIFWQNVAVCHPVDQVDNFFIPLEFLAKVAMEDWY